MQNVPREIAQTYSKDAFKNDLFSCISKSETSVQLCTYLNRPSWMVRGNWASVSLSQAPMCFGLPRQSRFTPFVLIKLLIAPSFKDILVWMINDLATLLICFLQTLCYNLHRGPMRLLSVPNLCLYIYTSLFLVWNDFFLSLSHLLDLLQLTSSLNELFLCLPTTTLPVFSIQPRFLLPLR